MKEDKVTFSNESIRLSNNTDTLNNGIIMHEVAKPLTRRFCEIVGQSKGDILDVGFGLGFSANYFNMLGVKSYTCIEINDEIFQTALEWASDKPNVSIIKGDWIDVIPTLTRKFDGIFMDTYGDSKEKYAQFETLAKTIANEGCVLSLWEYSQFRKLSDLNYITFPNQQSNYELALKPTHSVCWSYFFGGDFRKKNFYEKKNLLSRELCKEIIRENIDGEFRRDKTSANVQGIEHYRDLWTKDLHQNDKLFRIIKDKIFKHYRLLSSDSVDFCRFIKYEVDGRHDRHVETDRYLSIIDKDQYQYSLVITLNDEFEGGDFLIYDSWIRDDRSVYSDTKTTTGDIIKFNPYQHCETKKITRGTKYEIFMKIKRGELIPEPTSLL